MGRNVTDAENVAECLSINIKDLFTLKFIEKNRFVINKYIFRSRLFFFGERIVELGSVFITACFYPENEDTYIILSYSYNQKSIQYRIKLVSIPSNLGKGVIWYFQCPSTQKRCKILYLAYNSTIFQSRGAYNRILYYPVQMSSKYDLHNTAYWSLNNSHRLEKLQKKLSTKYTKYFYNNKATKWHIKWIALNKQLNKLNALRLLSLVKNAPILKDRPFPLDMIKKLEDMANEYE